MTKLKKGFIFSPESIAAILLGSKTQTRRPVARAFTPVYALGDHIAVRESFWPAGVNMQARTYQVVYQEVPGLPTSSPWLRAPEGDKGTQFLQRYQKRLTRKPPARIPGIFMPTPAIRLGLIITARRQEYLQNIGANDVKAEGYNTRGEFVLAWDYLNWRVSEYQWACNPLVWVYTFTRMPDWKLEELRRG